MIVKKNIIFIMCVLVLSTVIFFGLTAIAAEKNITQQIFRINIPQEPSVIDPAFFRDDNATSIIYAIHEPLIRISTSYKGWEPGLAIGFDVSDDRKVYTFHLRDNVCWEDGTAITVEDIVYSFRRCVDPKVASPKAFDYYDIKNAELINKGELPVEEYGVKALDEKTIQITLERPVDYFVEMIERPGFAPIQKKAGEEYKDLYGTDTGKVVSSGPFKLEKWEHDAEIVLVKNENYWDAKNVSLEKVIITLAKDPNTIIGMYKTGKLDFMEVSATFLPEFKNTPEFYTMPMARVSFIEFNPKVEYLKNIKIREAFSISFNRKEYVEKVLATGDLPAYGLVPPGIRGKNNGDFREQAGNLVTDMSLDPNASEKANKLLTEGLKEIGKTMKSMSEDLKMYCVDRPSAIKAAQAIQEMWRSVLGAKISVVPMQVKMLIPLLMSGEYQCVVGGGRTGVSRDPAYFLDFIYYEGKWDDPLYAEFIEKSFVTTGNERIDWLMKTEKYVLDKFVFIPQQFTVANYVLTKKVKDFRRYPVILMYDYKYIKIREES